MEVSTEGAMGRGKMPGSGGVSAAAIIFASVAVLIGLPGNASGQAAFTDITKESGAAEIVEGGYKADAKWWMSGIHFVDLDEDGVLDLSLSSHGGGNAQAAINDGTGHFAAAAGDFPKTEILLAYDLDEDGRADLAMNYLDGGARWWMNRSARGRLGFVETDVKAGGNAGRINVMLDVNRDGNVDWIRSQGGNIVIDLGDGKGGFQQGAATIPVTSGYRFEHAVIPADIDGDGEYELLVEWGRYAFEAGKCRVYDNEGGMKFADVTAKCGLHEDGLSIKGVGDFDQDGDIDIIAIENLKEFAIYLNDGKGVFTKKAGAISGLEGAPTLASWGIAATTDFDNDGTPDIIVNGKHFLKILRGTGGGNFTYMNKAWGIEDYSSASVDDGICFGDIDGDGDLDIAGYTAAGGEKRLVKVYRNDLARQNWINVRPVGLRGNAGAAGAKIRIYEPGTKTLISYEEVAIYGRQSAQSYYGLGQTERHFGLGKRDGADVSVTFYPSGKEVRRNGAKANATLTIKEDESDGHGDTGGAAAR